jgi:hypothetical protein
MAESVIWFVIFCGLIYMMTKRWFLALVLFLCGIAAILTMIASLIHFEILAALGCFILAAAMFSLTAFVQYR